MAFPVVPVAVVALIALAASSKPRRKQPAPLSGNGGNGNGGPVPSVPPPTQDDACWKRLPTDGAPFGFVTADDGSCVPATEMPTVFTPTGWEIPENWWAYRTPQAIALAFPDDDTFVPPLAVAYQLLGEELLAAGGTLDMLPPAPEPPEGEMWQTDVPNAANYYDGPEEILGLMYHLADFVNAAYVRWEAGDDFYLSPEV